MEEPALVSQAPAHSYRTPYLGIHTEDKLSPVVVALHTIDLVGSRTAPYRVLDIRTFEDALTFKLAMMVVNYIKYKKAN